MLRGIAACEGIQARGGMTGGETRFNSSITPYRSIEERWQEPKHSSFATIGGLLAGAHPYHKGGTRWGTNPVESGRVEESVSPPPGPGIRAYLLNGMRNGFQVGYRWGSTRRSNPRNMPSAREHPEVMEGYLHKELQEGRIVGPLHQSEFPTVHVSPCGVRPKSEPGKWRLIVDLSSPRGASVNDGSTPHYAPLPTSESMTL